MGLKKEIKNTFISKKIVCQNRFIAAKAMFIICNLLFFINFFLVGANMYDKYLIYSLPFTYIALILSIMLLIFFTLKYNFIEKSLYSYTLAVILLITGVTASVPFIIKL